MQRHLSSLKLKYPEFKEDGKGDIENKTQVISQSQARAMEFLDVKEREVGTVDHALGYFCSNAKLKEKGPSNRNQALARQIMGEDIDLKLYWQEDI